MTEIFASPYERQARAATGGGKVGPINLPRPANISWPPSAEQRIAAIEHRVAVLEASSTGP